MRKRYLKIFLSGRFLRQLKFVHSCFYIVFVIFLIVFFSIKSIGQSTYKSNDTLNPTVEENLGLKIFRAFQKGDDSLWVSLYPTNAEYRELTRLMTNAKIIKLPQSAIEKCFPGMIMKLHRSIKKFFIFF